MAADSIHPFLAATPEERFRLALSDDHAPRIRRYLGGLAFEEYVAIARRTVSSLEQKHLAVGAPPNLIFVPGVMGSLLQSQTLGGVWWVDVRTRHHLNDLCLAPDGQGDANPNHQIVPFATDPSYEPFLAAILDRDDFGHVTFPYDWRKPLESSALGLRQLVLKLWDANGQEKIHLVAHSMGGLIVRATLTHYGADIWPKLGRIVFVGTPHFGSPAIAGYVKNHLWGFDLLAVMGLYISRETFRSLWGAMSMLPAPAGVYPGTRPADPVSWTSDGQDEAYIHPCANFDMYDASSWGLALTPEETSRFQAVLNGAATVHWRMYEAHATLDQELRDRMAVIAGVGYKTLFRLAYHKGIFGIWQRMDKVTQRVPPDIHREGDGRVPLASAMLDNVGDTRFVRGVHGHLPMIPSVYDDAFRWLRGEPMQLPHTPTEALSHHLAADMTGVEAPHLVVPHSEGVGGDDPGYWDLTPPDPARQALLEARLAQDDLPDFNKVRIL